MRCISTLLIISALFLSFNQAHASCRPLMFGECCARQPCSYISWRGECCLPTYELYADFLFWQTYPEGLEFARVGGISTDPSAPIDETGSILAPKGRGKPGFRIGLIVDLPACTWDAFGRYTYLSGGLIESKIAENGSPGMKPLIWNLGMDETQDIHYAAGKWKYEVSVFDFGLGHNTPVCRCFNLYSHLGLKTAWQKFHYRVTYQDIVSQGTITQDQSFFMTEFSGVGIRGGIDADWNFCRFLSFVGGFSFSTLYSNINLSRQNNHTDNILSPSRTTVTNVCIKDDHCTLIPIAELLVGIQWRGLLCNGYEFTLMVAWEAQKWWNLNQFIFLQEGSNSNHIEFNPGGGITYQGLTTRLTLSF